MQTFFKKVESFSTPAEVHWWTLRHVPDITPRGSQCIRAWKEVEDGWFLYSRSKSFLSSFFSRPVPSIYPAVPLPGFLSPPGKIAGSETWHGAAAGGGRAGHCAVPLMEMDVGSELSPEQPPQRRERGGGSISTALPPGLQNSLNERGGLNTHDLIWEKEGETMRWRPAERMGRLREKTCGEIEKGE